MLLCEKDGKKALPTPKKISWRQKTTGILYGIAAGRIFYFKNNIWKLSAYRNKAELLETPLELYKK